MRVEYYEVDVYYEEEDDCDNSNYYNVGLHLVNYTSNAQHQQICVANLYYE